MNHHRHLYRHSARRRLVRDCLRLPHLHRYHGRGHDPPSVVVAEEEVVEEAEAVVVAGEVASPVAQAASPKIQVD